MSELTVSTVPAENPTPSAPAPVSHDRDLKAEKDAEAKAEKAKAEAKASRFAPSKRKTAQAAPQPEFETLILTSAVNSPPSVYDRPAPSTYVPNFAAIFYILNYMDFLMASTKRWTDNCMGWVPPYSQMYISVLLYVQTMRAMEAAGVIAPGSQISNILMAFDQLYPLNELWIPGPLVNAFRSISAFQPSTLNLFGNVTPALPAAPGWSAARHHRFNGNFSPFLPNVSIFISRLRHICTVATSANMIEATFQTHTDGPNASEGYFGHSAADSAANTPSPGSSFVYGGSLQLWQNAASRLNFMRVPADLAANTVVADRWTAAMRFDNTDNEHVWFGPVSAMMAKYCQFFNGSASLGSCPPTTSAAGATKCRSTGPTSMWTAIAVTPVAGTGASHEIGNANAAAHNLMRNDARLVVNARNAIPDLPDAHFFSGATFALNAYHTQAFQNVNRQGEFWTVGPDYSGRDNIEVLPGVLSTIMREYHSDTRLSPFKN